MANRPGRPALDRSDPSVHVHFLLPGRAYDALCKRAHVDRTTVPELIRRKLRNSENKNTKTSDR